MKTTNIKKRTAGIFRRSFTAVTAAVMISATAAGIAASTVLANAADAAPVISMNTNSAVTRLYANQYNGHDIISGEYERDGFKVDFKYSDGFFETEPRQYDPHIATMSCNLAYTSTTVESGDDYSKGPDTIKSVLSQMGFENLYASTAYTQEPTPDSVACAIGSKTVDTRDGTRKIVSVTVRSANYEKEWASNVTLGKQGEAEGFANAANQVTAEINQYLEDNDMAGDAANGNVIFWVSGFSRGGATANLTAKRLIDQFENGKVFAYTIEAPQGGMASEERSDRDYSCIHNIVCKDDPVPFVAPTDWGFKRYGVDHFIYNESWDSDNLRKSVFVNNLADNDGSVGVSSERLDMLKNEIDKITGDKAKDFYPVTSLNNKSLKFNWSVSVIPPDFDWWLEIADDGTVSPKDIINKFVASLGTDISREQYVDSGIQSAARRIMTFLNTSGIHIDNIIDAINLKDSLIGIAKNLLIEYLEGYLKQFKDYWYDPAMWPVWLPPVPNIDELVDALKDTLNDNQKIHDMFNNYDGGVSAAVDDLLNVAYHGLKGFDSINDILTFSFAIKDIYKNHSTLQSVCWLRTYDSWYTAPAHN